MFGTIRRHQTWLWVLIIGITIPSFVVYFGNNRSGGNQRGEENHGVIAGHPISRADLVDAMNEVRLDFFMKNEQWPASDSPEILQRSYLRLLLIEKEKELGVQISTEAVATAARNLLGPGGSLDGFVEKVLKPQGMDAGDLDRFLRHQLGVQQLIQTAGVTGKLVTPQEAETMYRQEHQDLATSLVYFSASNYVSKVMVGSQALAEFYTNQLANYRLPERVQVSYVKYNVTNFYPEALKGLTNLNELVEANIQKFGTNLYRNTRTPAESRAAIQDDLIRGRALPLAHKVAAQFAQDLDDLKPRGIGNLEKLAAQKGLTVMVTAPFGREYGPQEIQVTPDFAKAAFSLTTEDPFSGSVRVNDGVYVMELKARIPAETPPLKTIEDRVASDFRHFHAIQMAQQAAMGFDAALTNGLAQKKSFSTICAISGVKSETLPPFSLSTRSLSDEFEERISFGLIKQIAFSTMPGNAGQPANARDGAFVLYVDKRLPIDEAKLKTELPGFLAYLRQVREEDAFNLWFNSQIRQDPDFMQILQGLQATQVKAGAKRAKT